MSATESVVVELFKKTKLVCSSCGAPGEGSCRCGAPYVRAGARAEAAVEASPEKSDRAIAEGIGVSLGTVQRARKKSTDSNESVDKRVGKDGKARKAPTARKRPVEDRAREAVRPMVAAGAPVKARQVGEEIGVSHVMVEQAAAMERARIDLLGELGVDPETLAPSAKAKLEISKRMIERRLEAEHAKRMNGVEEEIRLRVVADGREYLVSLQEMRAKAERTEKLFREMTNDNKPLFTVDQFNLLRKCLHQQGIAATKEDFDAAFNLIQTKKLQLTGQK